MKALIRNYSKEKGISSQIILRIVLFEMFLEKLALSDYKDQFIIKGGFLISSLANIHLRTTMDLDITIDSLSLDTKFFKKVIQTILQIPTRLHLNMELVQMEFIHEEGEYSGLRATILVKFDGVNERVKIDFTTGDSMTPHAIVFSYPTILEGVPIQLKSYNTETVLSEKLETILSRGATNSRTRDFYDVHLLLHLSTPIDAHLFTLAFRNTSRNRGTYENIISHLDSIINSLSKDEEMRRRWKIYQEFNPYAAGIGWSEIIHSINILAILLQEQYRSEKAADSIIPSKN
jgi:hypothetical protein